MNDWPVEFWTEEDGTQWVMQVKPNRPVDRERFERVAREIAEACRRDDWDVP